MPVIPSLGQQSKGFHKLRLNLKLSNETLPPIPHTLLSTGVKWPLDSRTHFLVRTLFLLAERALWAPGEGSQNCHFTRIFQCEKRQLRLRELRIGQTKSLCFNRTSQSATLIIIELDGIFLNFHSVVDSYCKCLVLFINIKRIWVLSTLTH